MAQASGWSAEEIELYITIGSQSQTTQSQDGHNACPEAVEAAQAIMMANNGHVAPQLPLQGKATVAPAPAAPPATPVDADGTADKSRACPPTRSRHPATS